MGKKDVFHEHFMGNNEISNAKMELFQTEIRCLQIARMQDFAPNTPELLGALSGPQTPGRNESNPPQSFLATGMDLKLCIYWLFTTINITN